MKYYTTIKINNDDLFNMLSDRLDYWNLKPEKQDLFEKMYENAVDKGLFEKCKFDVNAIVDNDIANWCTVLDDNDEDFEKILQSYTTGEYNISCKTKYSYIEAVADDETRILVRY